MLDYYKILKVPESAGEEEIKRSYKQLAVRYHPDKNMGNPIAEDNFKKINEAYQILGDPVKKAQYDFRREYGPMASTLFDTVEHRPENDRRRRYPHYARYAQQNSSFGQYKEYKVDKKYFRDLLLTLVIFFLISACIVTFYEFNEYMQEQHLSEIKQQNHVVLQEAQELFISGEVRAALGKVSTLAAKYPNEKSYRNSLNQMLTNIRTQAQSQFDAGEYSTAAEHFEIIKDFEDPMNLNTWYKIAMCQYKMGSFRKATHALDYILLRDRQNVALIMQIAGIYEMDLDEPRVALGYYDEAKSVFKKFQSTSYGEAFELIMPPEDAPDIYYELFIHRADLHLKLKDQEEAIKDCNWAIFLRPERVPPYLLRGRLLYASGEENRACEDWAKAASLGSDEALQQGHLHCLTDPVENKSHPVN